MAAKLNAKKFSVTVTDVPQVPEESQDSFRKEHINDTYLDHHSEEAKARGNAAVLQFKRWEWAQGNQWSYINCLRLQKFSDVNIQAMADGLRPLCFTGPEIHSEFCHSLGEVAKALETELGWKNVRFIHTGSSVVGFSTNPLKGIADRPTKITSVDSSDVDVVVVADGIKEWIDKAKGEHSKALGHDFPSTRTRTTAGMRVGCWEPALVSPSLANWYDTWKVKLHGGVQLTFDTDSNPTIPPWESWIPIPQ